MWDKHRSLAHPNSQTQTILGEMFCAALEDGIYVSRIVFLTWELNLCILKVLGITLKQTIKSKETTGIRL